MQLKRYELMNDGTAYVTDCRDFRELVEQRKLGYNGSSYHRLNILFSMEPNQTCLKYCTTDVMHCREPEIHFSFQFFKYSLHRNIIQMNFTDLNK